jgi:protein TonB
MDIAATARPEFTFLKSLLGATCVTLGLLYFMHFLVHTEDIPQTVEPSGPIVDVVAVPKVIETRIEETKPEPPQDPAIEPTIDPPPMDTDLTLEGTDISSTIRYTPETGALSGVTLGGGGLVQQVMIPPTYPRRAIQKEVEGFVDVRFEVNGAGATTNVQVVHANPEGVFEKSAVRAVKRWKYIPDENRVAPWPVLTERIRFTLDQ